MVETKKSRRAECRPFAAGCISPFAASGTAIVSVGKGSAKAEKEKSVLVAAGGALGVGGGRVGKQLSGYVIHRVKINSWPTLCLHRTATVPS